MALLTTYTSANCVVSSALQIRYTFASRSQAVVYTADSSGTVSAKYPVYVTRLATKTYSYVGMTEAAARACAKAKIAKYTRNQSDESYGTYYDVDAATKTLVKKTVKIPTCQATITARQTSGDMWQCDIQVSESDRAAYLHAASGDDPTDPASLFSISCDYDEPTTAEAS